MLLRIKNRFDNREYDVVVNTFWVSTSPTIFQVPIVMPPTAPYGEYDYAFFATPSSEVPFEIGLLKYRPDVRETPVEYTAPTTYEQYTLRP